MATFKICVFEHQKRDDGKYAVSIRVTNNRQTAYISTGIYVVRKQIAKDFKTIKDQTVVRAIDKEIEKYEDIVLQKLGVEVNAYTAKELCEFLRKHTSGQKSINFASFAKSHIAKLIDQKRSSYANSIEVALNSLIDFFGSDEIPITSITSKSLTKFGEYLQTTRKITRKDKTGKILTIERRAVSDRTMSDYLVHIRTLFNAAINEYNDEDLNAIIISHYPFRRFKINTNHESKKRNLLIDQMRAIRDTPNADRAIRLSLARDVFMLSFYLVGMNLADMYDATDGANGRISYNRRKTSGRRADNAYISIKIEPEAVPLVEKYRDKTGKRLFCFHELYVNHLDFVKNVNIGLKQMATVAVPGVNLTSYYARHSWATIARNDCGVSKDDINIALNHVDRDMKITDIYLAKDWSLIDNANRKVIDLLNRE